MPNSTTSADEFGYNPQDPHTNGVPSDGVESSFREKAEEYLGGRRVQEFADAANERIDATSDYLRNAGAAKMRDDVEKLVKSNPGPALLVAATVGFLIGRTLNRH